MSAKLEQLFKDEATALGLLTAEQVMRADTYHKTGMKEKNFVSIVVGLKMMTREQVDRIKSSLMAKGLIGMPAEPPKKAAPADSGMASGPGSALPSRRAATVLSDIETRFYTLDDISLDSDPAMRKAAGAGPAGSAGPKPPSAAQAAKAPPAAPAPKSAPAPAKASPPDTEDQDGTVDMGRVDPGIKSASDTHIHDDAPFKTNVTNIVDKPAGPKASAGSAALAAAVGPAGGSKSTEEIKEALRKAQAKETVEFKEQASDPLVGKNIGGCRIISVLGEGGMGVVYKAEDISLSRIVALKVLPSRVTRKPVLVERFKREARAAAQVEHPNIVQVYRVGQEGDLHFIVMQFIKGVNLSDKVKDEGRLDAKTASNMMFNVAQGLSVAHEHGIIHRDIKPDNIMLTEKNEVKLADFGLAREIESDSDISQTGQVLGTPYYMSPEQCDGRPVDARADIYSLGATFYYLVTGVKPFTGDTPYQVLMKHISEPLITPREFAPDLPEEVEAIITKMMEKAPADRYPSDAALIDDLGKLLKKWDLLDADYQLPAEKARWPFWVAAAAVALVLLAVAATGLFFLKKNAEDNWQKEAKTALEAARGKAAELEEKHDFASAAAVFDAYMQEYGNSDWKEEAQNDRTRSEQDGRKFFAAEAGRLSGHLGRLETSEAKESIARLKGYNVSGGIVQDSAAQIKDLESELEAVERLVPLLASVEGLLESPAEGKYAAVEKPLADLSQSLFKRVRTLASEAFSKASKIKTFEADLAKARVFTAEARFDEAFVLLSGNAGDEVSQIGRKRKEEISKIESLISMEQKKLTEAEKRSAEAVEQKRFMAAAALFDEFKDIGVEKVRARAAAEQNKVRDQIEMFRLDFENAASKARRQIDAMDFAGAEKQLLAFRESDVEDVNARLAALASEINGRRKTPPGFAYVPADKDQPAFYIQVYEVTNREYAEFLKENPGHQALPQWTGREAPAEFADHPVANVTRTEAQAYASWLSTKKGASFSLPAENEWIRAAGGGGKRTFPFGEDASILEKINVCKASTVNTRALTQDKSPFGACHMAGNVSEWTSTTVEGRIVVKGGSFADPDFEGASTAFRVLWSPSAGGRLPFVGFRLAAKVE